MDDDNPYAPPISDLIVIDEKPGKDPLADRGARLVATILDGILGAVPPRLPAAVALGPATP